MTNTPVIWFTGMSGSGKSTLAIALEDKLKNHGYTVLIIDGDTVRDHYPTPLGFGREDVLTNNLHIAQKCLEFRVHCDVILVPVISPYQEIRSQVRKLLAPNFHLIYLTTTLENLKKRDPKGLYALAERGIIKDLIGYAKTRPYETPDDAELIVNTSNQNTIVKSVTQLFNYFEKQLQI